MLQAVFFTLYIIMQGPANQQTLLNRPAQAGSAKDIFFLHSNVTCAKTQSNVDQLR